MDETRLIDLENKVKDLADKVREPVRLPALIDVQTQSSIKNLIFYPISVSLESTLPQTAANFSTFFVADRPYFVVSITEIHGTAGSSTPTLQLERLQGTEALDAGDELLSTAISLSATANTVQYGTLKSSEVITIFRGDRLALKDAGTLTALVGVTVTVLLQSK